MKHIINVGDKFGKLTVLDTNYKKKVGKSEFKACLCKCDCGNLTVVANRHLYQKKVKGCGCLHFHKINPGDKFGKLKAVRRVEDAVSANGSATYEVWECLCECGNIINVRAQNLRNNSKTDCGCVRREKRKSTPNKRYPVVKVGMQYGDWTVLREGKTSTRMTERTWICQCKCGTVKELREAAFKYGLTSDCGCTRGGRGGKPIEMVGKKFGRLTVIERAEDKVYRNNIREVRYLCQCDCGNYKVVRGDRLRLGYIRSCGCLSVDKAKHLDVGEELSALSY